MPQPNVQPGLGKDLSDRQETIENQQVMQTITNDIIGSTAPAAAGNNNIVYNTKAPNYMTLPGKPPEMFEVYFQFDEDEPVKILETRSKFSLELTGTPQPKVRVGDVTASCVTFTAKGNIGGPEQKNFKIFLKPKK